MENQEHLLDWIQLINTENVGPITFYKLIKKHGNAHNALANLKDLKKFKIYPRNLAELELKKAQEKNIHIISKQSPFYPKNLSFIEDGRRYRNHGLDINS